MGALSDNVRQMIQRRVEAFEAAWHRAPHLQCDFELEFKDSLDDEASSRNFLLLSVGGVDGGLNWQMVGDKWFTPTPTMAYNNLSVQFYVDSTVPTGEASPFVWYYDKQFTVDGVLALPKSTVDIYLNMKYRISPTSDERDMPLCVWKGCKFGQPAPKLDYGAMGATVWSQSIAYKELEWLNNYKITRG